MKQIGISKIDANNPLLTTYVKRVKTWDQSEAFLVNNDIKINPFYAIYFNDLFLGASTINFDNEKEVININMINGSNNHEEDIVELSIPKLTSIAKSQYGENQVTINHVKKLSIY